MSKWIIITTVVILAGIGVYMFYPHPGTDSPNGTMQQDGGSQGTTPTMYQNKQAVIETSKGTARVDLYGSDAPLAVENFIRLAEKGYYNGVIFHRVIKGFVIQAGDPTATGRGGESAFGKSFADELDPSTPSYQAGYLKGVVAMANRGPNTNTSQFFIMLADNPLPHLYTIFGKVVSGQDVVDTIGQVPTDKDDKPLDAVTIKSVTIVDKQ